MKYVIAFLTVLCVIGCTAEIQNESPTINIPVSLRQENYMRGSCVWASTISLLNWQGLPKVAQWVRRNKWGGELEPSHSKQMDAMGLRYATETHGDVRFLDWCIKTRRGAGIVWYGVGTGKRVYGAHMINLVGLTRTTATLLDNNDPENLIEMPRAEMIKNWQKSGGWAMTVVYSPAAPLPAILKPWE